MATQALIRVNGSDGSNDDLPINSSVTLANHGLGGESTWTWQILYQPAGTADVLSSTSVAAPTFVPKKEGCYLVQLVVDQGLATEKTDTAIVGIRQLKSRQRLPAAGEKLEDGSSLGWEPAPNGALRYHDDLLAKGGIMVGAAGGAGLVPGNVLFASGVTVLKASLPGQESIPTLSLAHANVAGEYAGTLFVLEAGVNGSLTPGSEDLIRARSLGWYGPITGGGSALKAAVYLSDGGLIALSAGSNSRKIGTVIRAGTGDFDVMFDGGM